MKLEVYNIQGEITERKVDLSEEVFGIQPNDHAIYLDVKRIMANKRQGTHKAKERAEISGSTKKLRRQKGTGAARVGSIKSPLFRGGGRVFGPQPRDYSFKLNKKVKSLARKSALSYKLLDKQIIIVEDFNFDNAKTRDYAEILKKLKVEGKKNLMVSSHENINVFLSARNIPNSYICTPEKLNTYDILDNEIIVLTEGSIKVIEEILN
jgi:large subunit ribosomal protein L4